MFLKPHLVGVIKSTRVSPTKLTALARSVEFVYFFLSSVFIKIHLNIYKSHSMAMNSCSIRYVEYKRRLAGSKKLRSVQEKMTSLRAQHTAATIAAMLCKYYEILEVIFLI